MFDDWVFKYYVDNDFLYVCSASHAQYGIIEAKSKIIAWAERDCKKKIYEMIESVKEKNNER